MNPKKILIACEYSGRVRNAFLAKGHDATSCDILPTESPGPHYQGDVMDIINDGWDMMIAFPPCTYLANSGVRWLYPSTKYLDIAKVQRGTQRWKDLIDGAVFYRDIAHAEIEKIVMENPIMHGWGQKIIGTLDDFLCQIIQPWMFGHGETKATQLQVKGLPLLKPTNIVDGREARIHKMSPGPNRGKDRALILPGIANAFAEQWG